MGKIKKEKPGLKILSKSSVSDSDRTCGFKVSFQYLDTTQKYGSSFKDWQKCGLLSKALEVLQGYCCSPLRTQIDGVKFSIYDSFPPEDKTLFQFPKNVPEVYFVPIVLNTNYTFVLII